MLNQRVYVTHAQKIPSEFQDLTKPIEVCYCVWAFSEQPMERNSMKNINNIKDFNEYINSLVAEFKDSDHKHIEHYAIEVAEKSEYTIHYHNAWYLVELVSLENPELVFDAEEMAFDTDTGNHTSLNGVMASLAYFIIYVAILLEFSNTQEA